jgi:TrmH family RNA methyltransferase
MASGADDVLESAAVLGTLDEALADCVFAVAATARPRDLGPQSHDARGAAGLMLAEAARGRVALVFGNETSGLSNLDLRRCDALAHIPANPGYSSLNLAAAVQIFAYELRMAVAPQVPAPAGATDEPATRAEMESLFAHAEEALAALGFYDPANPKRLMPRLRRLAARARLEREEVNILRGMLTWAVRDPRRRGG